MSEGRQIRKSPICLVGASAGTGKTYRLTSAFADAVLGVGGAPPVSPRQVLATTFTNRAADEMADRIMQRLIGGGDWEAAQQVRSGYVGTVNSVCGRLISEFVLDAGVSPVADVLPEDRTSLVFSAATEPVVAAYIDQVDPIARRLSQENWREQMLDVCKLARANGIVPEQLHDCAQKSWAALGELLPTPRESVAGEALDCKLMEAIQQALGDLARGSDATKATSQVEDELKKCASMLRSGEPLRWSDWARLSKLKPGKSSEGIVQPVKTIAAMHPEHPGLHRDLSQFIELSFACAAEALACYQHYKRSMAFIDFTDQETLVLRLLDNPAVCDRLRQRLSVLLVDEFQDTSPVQLALFLKLAQLSDRSIWVGDEKQAIYGFRDTDPELMQSVIQVVVPDSGGSREHLARSYRAVPELVNFTNDLFSLAFPPRGISADKVVINECDRSSLGVPANLSAWWVGGTNWEQAIRALAAGVSHVLSNSGDWPVLDRDTGHVRPVRGGDIAILCRRNELCVEVAAALASRGLDVATSRHGLLSTPECSLAFAALRYLIDPSDMVAVAELLHFGGNAKAGENWLADLLDRGIQEVAASLLQTSRLNDARTRLAELTPGEALELAITAAGVVDTVLSWTHFRQRLSNLDAMRALSSRYEELCLARRSAATPAGFVVFLFRELERGGEQPPNPDENAVRVLTYHAAKGLEWPVVCLFDLGSPRKASPFGLAIETAGEAFDPWEPLKGRWIRSWPWPYGQQEKDVYLDATADSSSEMARARSISGAESVRLLYVGATRARDHLIFACRDTRDGTGWLDLLVEESGRPALMLPGEVGLQSVRLGKCVHPINVRHLEVPSDTESALSSRGPVSRQLLRVASTAAGAAVPLPLRIAPSSLSSADIVLDEKAPNVVSIGSRLPISGSPEMTHLGEAVHRFLSADNADWTIERRLELAADVLQRWAITELQPGSLVESADRLARFLAEKYAGYHVRNECPIVGRLGLQRVVGRIDMLLESDDGFVIIDHKSFPGTYDQWAGKAFSYRPQLLFYAQVVEEATGRNVEAMLVHMPIVGKVVNVT